MPHIIFSGEPDFRTYFDQFADHRGDSNGWIIKLKNCLISKDASLLLIDCTAVRSGFSQDFFIRAESKASRLAVRVDPYMKIERNEGVQRAIAAIAGEIRQLTGAGLGFEKSNLPPEILQDHGLSAAS